MFKLLFSTAIVAPVMVMAFASNGSAALPTLTTKATFASAALDTIEPASCQSDTLGVDFHHTEDATYLESHSAERLGYAFADVQGCETSFVRLTTLVPEDANDADLADAEARRTVLAQHITALVGPDAARDLPMRTDMRTSRNRGNYRLRSHALLRIERRPATQPGALASMAPVASRTNGVDALYR